MGSSALWTHFSRLLPKVYNFYVFHGTAVYLIFRNIFASVLTMTSTFLIRVLFCQRSRRSSRLALLAGRAAVDGRVVDGPQEGAIVGVSEIDSRCLSGNRCPVEERRGRPGNGFLPWSVTWKKFHSSLNKQWKSLPIIRVCRKWGFWHRTCAYLPWIRAYSNHPKTGHLNTGFIRKPDI